MVGVVPVVRVMLNRAELRIRPEVLILRANPVQLRRIGRDIQRQHVDVPIVQQPRAGRALIDELRQPASGEFVLEAA